mmetsp:Transcript_50016/g.161800  ORF Transcript_50016/g.161800 Transcript_50016/m.161800 type:complete len:379 (+) Transcript_50016:487-1623(+)
MFPAHCPILPADPAKLVSAARTSQVNTCVHALDRGMAPRAFLHQSLAQNVLDSPAHPLHHALGELTSPSLVLASQPVVVRRRRATHATFHTTALANEPWLLALPKPRAIRAIRRRARHDCIVSRAQQLHRAAHESLEMCVREDTAELAVADGPLALRIRARDAAAPIHNLGGCPLPHTILAEPAMATRPNTQGFSTGRGAGTDLAHLFGTVGVQRHHSSGISEQNVTGCMQVSAGDLQDCLRMTSRPHDAQPQDGRQIAHRIRHLLTTTGEAIYLQDGIAWNDLLFEMAAIDLRLVPTSGRQTGKDLLDDQSVAVLWIRYIEQPGVLDDHVLGAAVEEVEVHDEVLTPQLGICGPRGGCAHTAPKGRRGCSRRTELER